MVNSPMSICRTVHGAPVLRQIRLLLTLRVQKADPLMMRTDLRMRSGAYASSRQDTDYAEQGVVRSYDPRSTTEGPACLTLVSAYKAI
jgi:hypothetical protein